MATTDIHPLSEADLGRGLSPPRLAGEAELLRRARTHEGARNELIRRYQPLAEALARRYYRGGENLEDLVQVANLGLVNAARRFDPDRGRPFRAFVVPTVVGELKRYFRDHGWRVHLPRSIRDRISRLDSVVDQLQQDLHRAPRVSEVAERMGIDSEEVAEILAARRDVQALSLDAAPPDDADDAPSRAELTGSEDRGFENVEQRVALARAMRALSARERLVLSLRYGHELTQREIAERLGVSQMQVSRILNRVAERLRILTADGPLPADAPPVDGSETEPVGSVSATV